MATHFRILRILQDNPGPDPARARQECWHERGGWSELLPQRPYRQGICEDGQLPQKQEQVQVRVPAHPRRNEALKAEEQADGLR